MNPKSFPKPIFPHTLLIQSRDDYNTCRKRHYRAVKVFGVDFPRNYSRASPKLALVRSEFKQTTKKLKHVSKIILHKHQSYFNFPRSWQTANVKHFRDVKSAILPTNPCSADQLDQNIRWIRYAKRLKTLYLTSSLGGYSYDERVRLPQTNQILINRLEKELKISRIQSIAMNVNPETFVFQPNYFPKGLKKLSLSPIYNYRSQPRGFSLSANYEGLRSLKSLQILKVTLLLEIKTASLMLSSLHSPKSVTHITLFIYNPESVIDENYREFAKKLELYRNLESLNLQFTGPLKSIKTLTALSEHPLRHLHLKLSIKQDEQMVSIGYFLGALVDLETLKLELNGDIKVIIPESSVSMITQISQLKQLRTLRLRILTKKFSQTKNSLSALSECIDQLPNLKRLEFQDEHVDYSKEFNTLVRALSKKAQQLESLDLTLSGKAPNNNDLMEFAQLIEEAVSLRDLRVKGLVCSSQTFLVKLCNALDMSKSLETLVLLELTGKINRDNLIPMIEAILRKPSLKEIAWGGGRGIEYTGKKDKDRRVNVKDALKANPTLKSIVLPDKLWSGVLEHYRWGRDW